MSAGESGFYYVKVYDWRNELGPVTIGEKDGYGWSVVGYDGNIPALDIVTLGPVPAWEGEE
jgi:hypothetical protein